MTKRKRRTCALTTSNASSGKASGCLGLMLVSAALVGLGHRLTKRGSP